MRRVVLVFTEKWDAFFQPAVPVSWIILSGCRPASACKDLLPLYVGRQESLWEREHLLVAFVEYVAGYCGP